MSVGLTTIRIVLGLYLTAHGLQKATPRLGFGGIAGAAQDFARSGVRGGRAAAVLTAMLQLGTGILLAIGLLTPLAAMAAAGVMTVATQTRLPTGFWSQRGGFEYPALLPAISLALIWSGGGRYSVDTAIPLHAPDWPLALAATLVTMAAAVGTTSLMRTRLALRDPTGRTARRRAPGRLAPGAPSVPVIGRRFPGSESVRCQQGSLTVSGRFRLTPGAAGVVTWRAAIPLPAAAHAVV